MAGTIYTFEQLQAFEMRGPVRFYDGRNGMARQDFEAVGESRLGYSWRRENRKDKGRQFYTVDGAEIENLEAAIPLLAASPDPESPREIERLWREERKQWPKTTSLMSAPDAARYYADAGPFAMLKAWHERTGNAWHGGVNAWSEACRKAGEANPGWAYNGMSWRGVCICSSTTPRLTLA